MTTGEKMKHRLIGTKIVDTTDIQLHSSGPNDSENAVIELLQKESTKEYLITVDDIVVDVVIGRYNAKISYGKHLAS